MASKPKKKSVVLISSGFVSRFEKQLVPFLKARGIFPNGGGNLLHWLSKWLESPTGFFWGAFSKQPEVGGIYRVCPRPSKPAEEGGFITWFRIGDYTASVLSEQPLSGTLGVRVTGVVQCRVDVVLIDTLPEQNSPFKIVFRVFHTADGVTGELTAFAGTEAMQLMNVMPNELLPMSFLVQLPEMISVRKNMFPLEAVLLSGGRDDETNGYRLCCDCHNCDGDGEVECEKCDGTGQLTCNRCGGTGSVTCKKCEGSGTITLPPKNVTCKKCKGAGTITLPSKNVRCRKCGGSGRFRRGSFVGECNLCGGSGSVHLNSRDIDCSLCNGTGVLHWDEHDVDCSCCKGTGHLDCSGCSGSGSIQCFACHGKGKFECWVCKGVGALQVLVDFKADRFYRKYKDEITWLAADDVYLFSDNDDEHIPLSGCWHDIRQEVERQSREEEERRSRSDRIVRDGYVVDSCLDLVLRLSPAMVKPFEVKDMISIAGRSVRGRVFYEFSVRGNAQWLRPKSERSSAPGEEPADQNESPGPFQVGTHVSFDGVSVPEGKTILYEGCDEIGRNLVFSFPIEVERSSLEGRTILVKADAIPPPEKRERERLGVWLENRNAPILRGLVDGVEEERVHVRKFLNDGISKFPVQVDAIQQGLSGASVLLLKGPPGTGKTTVIVELIRQAVRQGKRVLLTSQTHQAVDNVLERLHKFRESGEDRSVRMAVYSANESKISELGRRYMAGGQEEECLEIRERAEAVFARLEAGCIQNRMIRNLLAEGEKTASAISMRLKERDSDIKKAGEKRDRDIGAILKRSDEKLAKANGIHADFVKENNRRQRSIKKSIDLLTEKISKLKSDRALFSKRTTRRSTFFKRVSDRFLGTCFDPENAKQAAQATQKKLDTAEAELRKRKEELAEAETAFKEAETCHDATCAAIEKKKDCESKAVRKAYNATCSTIKESAEKDTNPFYEAQRERLSALAKSRGIAEKGRLDVRSDPADWTADIPRLDQEFADLDKRRAFALDWVTELKASPKTMSRFLNAQTNVFFATCVGMGSWRALSDGTYEMRDESAGGAGRTVFDIAIVDEAGHATFAETVVPMCSAKKVILIGDDKQLPPMLGEDLDCRRNMDESCHSCAVGADGRQCWFEYSMFQYLWENDKAFKLPRLMLDTQFRMHPDIADFISETFYEGKIQNGVTAKDRKFAFGEFQSAVCLLSTSGQKNHFEKWIGTSCTNPLEAEYVKRIVEELLTEIENGNVTGGPTDKPLSIAVITPYAAQETLLRRNLAGCFLKTDGIVFSEEDIASVDRFQGDERDIVIASFVRSPDKGGKRARKLTFVHDLKRMNVAFSRARRMLILVGDINALESARGSELGRAAFARFHKHVDKRGRQILVWERRAR